MNFSAFILAFENEFGEKHNNFMEKLDAGQTSLAFTERKLGALCRGAAMTKSSTSKHALKRCYC